MREGNDPDPGLFKECIFRDDDDDDEVTSESGEGEEISFREIVDRHAVEPMLIMEGEKKEG